MIEAEYRRDPEHNYMIPQMEIPDGEGYMLQMLAENRIPGLLPVKLERMNGGQTVCYEITSRQPLETMFARQGMERRDVVSVMQAILLACESTKAYLLNPADLVLLPAMMYMEPDSRQVSLCYLPGYGQRDEDRMALAEFMIRHLSHQDRGAVDLAYGFYEKAGRENAGFAEVISDLLCREKEHVDSPQSEHPGKNPGEEKPAHDVPDNKTGGDEPWEEEEWLNQMNGEKKEPGPGAKKRKKQMLVWGGAAAVCLAAYVLLSWLCRLDLTQMGGLAFLMISVSWLVYSAVTGRRQKNRNHWLEDVGDEEEEDAYMQQLMSEVYADGEESAGAWDKVDIRSGKNLSEGDEQYGQTRMLRTGSVPEVVLVSENLRYPNLQPAGEVCLLGKQAQRVDLVLPMHDSISRIHAKLECTNEGVFVTDMNSTNGTKINGNQIAGRSRLHPGDRVSFASFSYQVRFTEESTED